jgi:hypothetical protein
MAVVLALAALWTRDGLAADAAKPDSRTSTHAFLEVPLFSEAFATTPVAKVGDEEVVTMRELTDALGSTHDAPHMPAATPANNWNAVLERLINVHAMLAEAHTMGLDDKPEVKAKIDEHEDQFLRELFKRRAVKGIKADPKEVEKLYAEATIRWKLTSALMREKADAEKVIKVVAGGKPVAEAVAALVAEKKADAPVTGDYLGPDQLLPPVVEEMRKLKPGGVAPLMRMGPGFVVLRLDDSKHVDDPKAKVWAEESSIEHQQQTTLRKLYDDLAKKYAKIDRGLLDRLDLEAAKPGLDALAKDTRAIATIAGGKPVTVGDLVVGIQKKFFHGADSAVREKRVNLEKVPMLESLVYKKLFLREAIAVGLKDSDEYKTEMRNFTQGLLVDTYATMVIIPDVKVSEDDGKKYYEQHKNEFSFPAFYKLQSLGFRNASAAESAMEKVRAGTDWAWLKANADGQLPEGEREIDLDGQSTLSATAIDAGLAAVLTGTKVGDLRLWKHPKGGTYVVRVRETTPARTQAYTEARSGIGQKLVGQKLGAAVEETAKKLRTHYAVKVYLTRIGNN